MAQLDFQAVRLKAIMLRTYYGLALCALTPIAKPGLGTFAIDRYGRIYYNPVGVFQTGPDGRREYVSIPWKVEEAAWVLIHELNHWLRAHHKRAERYLQVAECRSCSLEAINRAQDCEINDDLRAEGAKLPAGGESPHLHGLPIGQLWEQYYPTILAERGHGQGHSYAPCGSAAHGVPQPYEAPAPGTDPQAPPGFSEAETDLIRDATAQAVLDHVRQHGHTPAGLRRWAEGRLSPPQVPWERELGAQTRAAVSLAYGAIDYSYAKRSRRGSFCGVIQPAMVKPVPLIAVVLDTSGSMAETRELPAALAEIPGIARAYGQHRVPVICCDAAAAPVQFITKLHGLQLLGGGGTDMSAGIVAAQKLHIKTCIVLTDGETDWPVAMPTGMELVIGLIRPRGDKYQLGLPHYAKRVIRIHCRAVEAA